MTTADDKHCRSKMKTKTRVNFAPELWMMRIDSQG
jgi:hypothetical protein